MSGRVQGTIWRSINRSLKRAKVKFESETILTRNGADRDLVTPKQSPVRSTNGMTVAVGLLPDPTCTPATVHED